MTRVPEIDKWNFDMLSAVSRTPIDMHQPREQEVVFKDKVEATKHEFVDKPLLARQVYLRPSDFDEFGFTRGCARCDRFRRDGEWGTRPHSQACRERISEALAKTEQGKVRLGIAAERLGRDMDGSVSYTHLTLPTKRIV